jgi:hypothetical protein
MSMMFTMAPSRFRKMRRARLREEEGRAQVGAHESSHSRGVIFPDRRRVERGGVVHEAREPAEFARRFLG